MVATNDGWATDSSDRDICKADGDRRGRDGAATNNNEPLAGEDGQAERKGVERCVPVDEQTDGQT